MKQPLLVVCPADEGVDTVVAGVGFQLEVVAKPLLVVVGSLQPEVDVVLRIVAGEMARLEHGVPHLELREIGLEAELVVDIVVEPGDTCLVDHGEWQLQCLGDVLGVLYGQQQREVVLLNGLLLLRGVYQRRDISLEGVHETRDDGGERICSGDLPVQYVGRDYKMAVFGMPRCRYQDFLQEEAARGSDEREVVDTYVALQIVDAVAREVGIQPKGDVGRFVFVGKMETVGAEMLHVGSEVEQRVLSVVAKHALGM